MNAKWIKSKYTILLGILTLAAGFKFWLIFSSKIPFNSDEAVVAIMARHILAGERPVFFYGQAYMGSLDAFLVAVGFAIFGQQVWVIRLIQTGLYLATMLTTYAVGSAGFQSDKAGLAATLIMALPAVNTTLYTTATLGGYGEALLIGSLTLLAAVLLSKGLSDFNHTPRLARLYILAGLLGLLTGLGLWAFGLSLIFSLAAAAVLVFSAIYYRPKFYPAHWMWMSLFGFSGFLLGSAPWWWYAAQHGFTNLLQELTGSAVAIETASFTGRIAAHMVNYFLLGLPAMWGLRPPWEVRWLMLPLLPLALLAWTGILVFSVRQATGGFRPIWGLLWGVVIIQAGAFLFTPFGIDPSGRYFLPLIVPLSLMAGYWVGEAHFHSGLKWASLGLILVFQAGGNIQSAIRNPPGLSTQFGPQTQVDHTYDQELIRFLQDTGEMAGYSNYWVTYPLAFLSGEKMIFIPALPYHQDLRYTARDDRYLPYREFVSQNARAAFITTGQALVENEIRASLQAENIHWSEAEIGDYRIFYHLSQKPDLTMFQFGDPIP